MKKYNLHWLDGTIETVSGNTIADAITNAGYGSGAISALDYYERATEVPMQYKDIILVENGNRDELSRGTLFAKQVLAQLAEGTMRVVASVAGSEWTCDVFITPFEILFNCVERKRFGKVVYSAA